MFLFCNPEGSRWGRYGDPVSARKRNLWKFLCGLSVLETQNHVAKVACLRERWKQQLLILRLPYSALLFDFQAWKQWDMESVISGRSYRYTQCSCAFWSCVKNSSSLAACWSSRALETGYTPEFCALLSGYPQKKSKSTPMDDLVALWTASGYPFPKDRTSQYMRRSWFFEIASWQPLRLDIQPSRLSYTKSSLLQTLHVAILLRGGYTFTNNERRIVWYFLCCQNHIVLAVLWKFGLLRTFFNVHVFKKLLVSARYIPKHRITCRMEEPVQCWEL